MYTIYAVKHCPKEMLDKYPSPALYAEGQLYLFGETLQEVAGVEPIDVSDIAAMGFNHPFIDGEAGLTTEQLMESVDRLLGLLGSAEVRLSAEQGKFLYETRFKSVARGNT